LSVDFYSNISIRRFGFDEESALATDVLICPLLFFVFESFLTMSIYPTEWQTTSTSIISPKSEHRRHTSFSRRYETTWGTRGHNGDEYAPPTSTKRDSAEELRVVVVTMMGFFRRAIYWIEQSWWAALVPASQRSTMSKGGRMEFIFFESTLLTWASTNLGADLGVLRIPSPCDRRQTWRTCRDDGDASYRLHCGFFDIVFIGEAFLECAAPSGRSDLGYGCCQTQRFQRHALPRVKTTFEFSLVLYCVTVCYLQGCVDLPGNQYLILHHFPMKDWRICPGAHISCITS